MHKLLLKDKVLKSRMFEGCLAELEAKFPQKKIGREEANKQSPPLITELLH